MKVEFRKSFLRDVKRVTEKATLKELRHLIESLEAADDISQIPNLKKLRGERSYYRIRLGDFRLGLVLNDDGIECVRFMHRKEIYRYFPK